jgi:hypothetical protein
MAKRCIRDMLKARAWNSQVSLADVDPDDHLGVKRTQIAAADRSLRVPSSLAPRDGTAF